MIHLVKVLATIWVDPYWVLSDQGPVAGATLAGYQGA